MISFLTDHCQNLAQGSVEREEGEGDKDVMAEETVKESWADLTWSSNKKENTDKWCVCIGAY